MPYHVPHCTITIMHRVPFPFIIFLFSSLHSFIHPISFSFLVLPFLIIDVVSLIQFLLFALEQFRFVINRIDPSRYTCHQFYRRDCISVCRTIVPRHPSVCTQNHQSPNPYSASDCSTPPRGSIVSASFSFSSLLMSLLLLLPNNERRLLVLVLALVCRCCCRCCWTNASTT